MTSAVPIVRTEPTAEDSLAAIFERSRLGIAIAAMIKMIVDSPQMGVVSSAEPHDIS